MSVLRKFTFDLSFDEPEPPSAAAPAPEPEVEAPPPPPPPPSYSQAELDQARKRAQAEGRAAGFREAEATTHRIQADALRALAVGLRDVAVAQRTAHEEMLKNAVELAIAAVRKLHPELARLHGTEEIGGVIAACLAQIDAEARITVRVAPGSIDEIKAVAQRIAAEAEFEGKLLFAPDPALAPGDCRVEWGGGGADRDQSQIWAQIDAIIARAADDLSAAKPAKPN